MTGEANPFASHWLIRDIVISAHLAAAGSGAVLFVGDSIVEGFFGDSLAGRPLVNAGYCGIGTEALEGRAGRLAEAARPAVTIVLVGTNDAKKGQDADGLAAADAALDRIVAAVRASSGALILVTPPPVEPGRRLSGFYDPQAMRRVAGRIAARGDGARIVDLHEAFRDQAGVARPGTTVDGIHLAPASYAALRAMLERAVTGLLP